MTFLSVLRSESTKILSLRSTRWTLLVLVLATAGFGALFSLGASQATNGDAQTDDRVGVTLAGIVFGQLAIAVLGVLTMTGEYGTGAIRGTFVAVPRRGLVLTAKATLVALLGLLFGWVASFGAFFAGRPFWDYEHLPISLSDPGALRAVLGGGLYLAASGLFGFALGALLRRTAGAVVATIAGLLVLPGLTNLLPGGWGQVVVRYFTSNAGQQIGRTQQDAGMLGPWTGFGAYCVWWAVILAVAYVLVQRRDA